MMEVKGSDGMMMDFDSTFNMMFGMSQIIFFLVFGIIIVTLIRSLLEWNKNNNSPKIAVEAKVVAKTVNISRSHHHHHNTHMHTHTTTSSTYYITFEFETGDRMELHVPRSEYGMIVEGDQGKLTFQGTRYISFERTY